jgi:hypothetical protein
VTAGTDAVRDDLRGYGIDAFGDDGGVLVVDETGDLRKGVHCVGGGAPVHRMRQAESAVTAAAADRAPCAGETAKVRRHAAAVLHLLWVGGEQLCISPEDWPNELADTVLAAGSRHSL